MPSLNVAPYIRECIESVIHQELQEIEIICVDAGSTDGTVEVLQEYAAQDQRIQLLHSDQKSYGHQMNMGFEAATGEYIGIVETDDFISRDMYYKLYSAAVNADFPDVVKSPYYNVNPPDDIEGPLALVRFIDAKTGDVFPLSEHFELICDHPSIWSCIYKKRFLDDKQIRMMECPGAAWVDNPFLYRTLCEAERICWVDEPFYYYRRTNPNASSFLKDCSIPMARINDIKDYMEENYPNDRLLEKHLFFRTLIYIERVMESPYLTDENKQQIKATVKRFHPYIVARVFLGRRYRLFRWKCKNSLRKIKHYS